jgi:diguanylate cyclase (GGDEF)-like protein
MESAATPARVRSPIDVALLAVAMRKAASALADARDPAASIDRAMEVLHTEIAGLTPSVFVLDHGRFWLVAQRGYSVVPDGIRVVNGIMGRAVRLGSPQLVPDVTADADYFAVRPGIVSELAVPLRAGRAVVGALNLESDRALPDGAAEATRSLASALGMHADALRTRRTLDLASLARLFVHLSSMRDASEIAALAAASLPRILPVDASQVITWDELGVPATLSFWRLDGFDEAPFTQPELEAASALVDPSIVCQVLDPGPARGLTKSRGPVVWLPLRVNGKGLGALLGRSDRTAKVDPVNLDTAAVLAAHVAASLDAAFALGRERQSAVTDSLTGILNRRGFEERLEHALAIAQDGRMPLSILVIDCDDFKEINDRAGHEFGDSLLCEIADALIGSLPEGAVAARIGGDEFVVMLPDAGADAADALGGQIRRVLAEGLMDAGFPLRISAGVSTYPFDGASSTALLRAADQALYAAKNGGKDRVASFRDVVVTPPGASAGGGPRLVETRRRGRSDTSGSVLADALAASAAIEAEESVEAVCNRLCKALVFVVGATACSASRVVGDFVVDATDHTLRDVSLGEEAAYRIDDFPLTAEVLRTGRPRAISFADGDVDPAEAFILRELGMNALLLLPLQVSGRSWGLIELYEMRLRSFTDDEVAVAEFLTAQAARRLEVVDVSGEPAARPGVYELPDDGATPAPRMR